MQLESARDEIMNSGFRLGSVSRQSAAGRDPGVVVNQSPAAGTALPRGADVNVTIAQ
jgi:beta-lactam-binding protein with PASTA domain